MRQMKKAIQLIILLLISNTLLAQNAFEVAYEKDPNISDRNGMPTSNESNYIPIIDATEVKHYYINGGEYKLIDEINLDLFVGEFGKETIKDSVFHHRIDPIKQRISSKYLLEFEEPVLHNYYLSRDIIRFTYIPAFDHPIVIKLENRKDSSLLTVKILDYKISDSIIVSAYRGDISLISTCDNDAEWIVNKQTLIDASNFETLQMFISNLNIKDEVPFYNIAYGEDGADWIIEVHNQTGYYYNYRWSPQLDSSIRKVADYLIGISELSEYFY